jgi:hypothetical protein
VCGIINGFRTGATVMASNQLEGTDGENKTGSTILDFFQPKRKRVQRGSSSSSTDSGTIVTTNKYEADESITEEEGSKMASENRDDAFETSDSVEQVSGLMEESDSVLENVITILDKKLSSKLEEFKLEFHSLIKESLVSVIKDVSSLRKEVLEVKKENIYLRRELMENKRKAIRLEAQSRKDNIRIWGLKEKQSEDCPELVVKMIQDKLKLNASKGIIDVAHRLPKTKTEVSPAQVIVKFNKRADKRLVMAVSPAQVIVKFNKRADKRLVMANRKLLKGTGIIIRDDLCVEQIQLMNRLRKDDKNVSDVWAWESKVYFKDKKDKVHRIEFGQTVDEVIRGRILDAEAT